MTAKAAIEGLQNAIQETTTFRLENYFDIGKTFLEYIQNTKPTRIVSPAQRNNHYIFYQYGSEHGHKITRPLNTHLFKTNHFLGYTVALNKLDGVYYVDPRPEMTINEKLKEQIRDFQTFLTRDLWVFSE
jgi:hypothetical protein